MNNQQRIERALMLVDQKDSILVKKNCGTCRYVRKSSWNFEGTRCTNPLVRAQDVDAVRGTVRYRNAEMERRQSGLCGPDGILWQKQPIYGVGQPRYYRSDGAKFSVVMAYVVGGVISGGTALAWVLSHLTP